MRKFLVLALLAGFVFNCSHKKKGLLFPLFFLGNLQGGTSGVPGNTGSPGVIFVPGDGSGNPVVVTPTTETPSDSTGSTGSTDSNTTTPSTDTTTSGGSSDSNTSTGGTGTTDSGSTTTTDSSGSSDSSTSGSTDSGTTTSGTTDSGSASGSTDTAGSGSTSNSDSNTSGGSGDTGTTPVATVVVEDPTGTPTFNYNTTINIPLNLTVTDKKSNVVSGATVLVYDENNNLLFQGVSDSSGKVTGTLTVPTSVGNITIDISIGGESISQYISLQDVLGINRTVRYEITLPSNQVADSDGDGIPDSTDIYPEDVSRSTEVAYPSEGVFTVAFEDLYPSPGDADLNDYVIEFRNEEDLNASGKIVRLRGVYQHVAKGAGYTHKLLLVLPVDVGATVTYKRTDANGSSKVAETTYAVTAAQLKAGFEILPDSSKTIKSQNANPGDVFKPGHIATLEIVFDTPVERAKLGAFPYDLFAYVISTNQNIHFPGLYKNSNGTDKYLDSTGFPWAILVPGAWKYPYERNDIRNSSQTGYGEFSLWVSSGGKEYKTWYNNVTNESKVFPVPSTSGLMGYLFLSIKNFAIFYAIGLVLAGAIAIYFLRRRQGLTI